MSDIDLREVLSGERRSWAAASARCALAAAAPFYGAVVKGRNLLFDLGLRRVRALPRPTISVGNLTVGGTGKTPMVVELVRRLAGAGQRPAVLLRGYRGGPDGSDEAVLLSSATGGATVVADPDRSAAARAALARDPNISIFVLDDAFQHRQVGRDLDIVLVDASMPPGLSRLLPRGLLREPFGGLGRAGAVVVTHAEQVERSQLEGLDRRIAQVTGSPPLAHAEHRWSGYLDADGNGLSLDALAHARVWAFCGIANPAAFSSLVARHVGEVLDVRVFPDHHPYGEVGQLERIFESAAGADYLVTTEKDWVKLCDRAVFTACVPPIVRPVLTMAFTKGEAQLDAILHGAVGGHGRE